MGNVWELSSVWVVGFRCVKSLVAQKLCFVTLLVFLSIASVPEINFGFSFAWLDPNSVSYRLFSQ